MNVDYDLYVIHELNYKKEHSTLKDSELFPKDWYSFKNYKLKIKIIKEAIENKVLIKDTVLYKGLEKDVK